VVDTAGLPAESIGHVAPPSAIDASARTATAQQLRQARWRSFAWIPRGRSSPHSRLLASASSRGPRIDVSGCEPLPATGVRTSSVTAKGSSPCAASFAAPCWRPARMAPRSWPRPHCGAASRYDWAPSALRGPWTSRAPRSGEELVAARSAWPWTSWARSQAPSHRRPAGAHLQPVLRGEVAIDVVLRKGEPVAERNPRQAHRGTASLCASTTRAANSADLECTRSPLRLQRIAGHRIRPCTAPAAT